MIKTVSQVAYEPVNGAKDYIFAWSTIRNVPNGWMINTRYFREGQENGSPDGILILAADEFFSSEQIDAIFDQLEPLIGSLPFTQMVEKGIELALFQHLNTHDKFGIAPNSGGWEIL